MPGGRFEIEDQISQLKNFLLTTCIFIKFDTELVT